MKSTLLCLLEHGSLAQASRACHTVRAMQGEVLGACEAWLQTILAVQGQGWMGHKRVQGCAS